MNSTLSLIGILCGFLVFTSGLLFDNDSLSGGSNLGDGLEVLGAIGSVGSALYLLSDSVGPSNHGTAPSGGGSPVPEIPGAACLSLGLCGLAAANRKRLKV